jgi:hypothetical protein
MVVRHNTGLLVSIATVAWGRYKACIHGSERSTMESIRSARDRRRWLRHHPECLREPQSTCGTKAWSNRRISLELAYIIHAHDIALSKPGKIMRLSRVVCVERRDNTLALPRIILPRSSAERCEPSAGPVTRVSSFLFCFWRERRHQSKAPPVLLTVAKPSQF